jgi:asparagine synthase (glutamine-hydrolysing)
MCGIAGLALPGRVPDPETLGRISACLYHRGPDDSGMHFAPGIGLGFRRLAIIDLTSGNQPVSNEDGQVVSVFNGEIYNYHELRSELEAAGHRFRTRGDAEVLPHLYEEHGVEMVHRLRGMFAIALWDSRLEELLLIRDRAGEKPLYYSTGLRCGGLVFGSEIKSLLAAGVSREPDLQAILEYLYYLYIPAPRSAFAAVKKLPPGHLLRYRNGDVKVACYWTPHFHEVARTESEHVEGLRERVLDAVRSRLIADVPVGAFLSGGIDSASVVAAMAHVHQGPVHTFTITFDGFEHYDESAEARAAARHFGTDHHELRASLHGSEMLPSLVESFDEPFGNATAVLVSSLSEATREHVKVVLTGDGADELFFGYPRYRGLDLLQRYQRWTPATVRKLAAWLSDFVPEDSHGRHEFRRAREFLAAGPLDTAEAYKSWIGYFLPERLEQLVAPGLSASPQQVTHFLDDLLGGVPEPDLNAISAVELQSFLPYNVLDYADKMSMAHGLELRAPFVDHLLVDYVATMPSHLKLHNGATKWALRQALARDLPPAVLTRRKRGLNPPLADWLSNAAAPLVREMLSPEAVLRRGLFRPESVSQLLAEQESRRRDRSLHIWALLVLELWFRMRVDSFTNSLP